jgi:hypothetical protein
LSNRETEDSDLNGGKYLVDLICSNYVGFEVLTEVFYEGFRCLLHADFFLGLPFNFEDGD